MKEFKDFFNNSDLNFLEMTKANANQIAPRIYWLNHLLVQEVSNTIKEYNLTFADLDILSNFIHLGKNELTPSQLSSKSLVTAGAITNILKKLELQGLIKRVVSKEDKRIKPVIITKKGKELIQEAFEKLLEKEREIFSTLPNEQMENKIHSLDSLISTIEKNR